MNCRTVNRNISGYLDGQLPDDEYRTLAVHLQNCPACATHAHQLKNTALALRALPQRTPPVTFSIDLRALASCERQRTLSLRGGIRARFKARMESFRWNLNPLMRPLAIPATGGVVSTVFLFAMLVSIFSQSGTPLNYDVPVSIAGETRGTNLVPVGFSNGEVVVNMVMDAHGHIENYSVTNGQGCFCNGTLRMKDNLIMPTLMPGSSGQPLSGGISISLTPLGLRY